MHRASARLPAPGAANRAISGAISGSTGQTPVGKLMRGRLTFISAAPTTARHHGRSRRRQGFSLR
jgi:hypothetical protein